MKSRFLLHNIRDTADWNPVMFFSTCKAGSLLDLEIHPEDLGILMDKKLQTNSSKVYYMVQIPIKSDQISYYISNYAIK